MNFILIRKNNINYTEVIESYDGDMKDFIHSYG